MSNKIIIPDEPFTYMEFFIANGQDPSDCYRAEPRKLATQYLESQGHIRRNVRKDGNVMLAWVKAKPGEQERRLINRDYSWLKDAIAKDE